MPNTQRIRSLLAGLLRHRLFLLLALIGAAYLFSVGTAEALPPAPGRIPNGAVYYCGTCHQSGHSSGVPMTPAHGDAMRNDYLAANKTWTVTLANQDSDGDGFTNGEELQDPSGAWAIGQAAPGNVFFVSNPSDEDSSHDLPTDECTLSYRATPPEPQLLDIVGYASPASGMVSFGVVSGRSPLPIDHVRYTVKNGSNTTLYDFSSTSAPFRSGVWNTSVVQDGSYTVVAELVEKRKKAGVTARSSSVSETIVVKNSAPVFGPVGEVVGTPSDPCGISEALNGIAAISQSDIWAVGTRFVIGPGDQTVIKHWDGLRWTTVISPSAGNYTSNLHAISASGASDVWAVGEYFNGAVNQTLIERWDGTVWKIVPSPNEGSVNDSNRLRGVVALSPTNAWAVGDYDDGSSQRPLILRWNGTSWQRIANVPVPPNADVVTLKGIAVVSANDAWAVGSYRDGGAILEKTLILRWNGTVWNIVPSPNPNIFRNGLNAVTAVSASDIWAVGYTSDGSGNKTLALRWNGASWQAVSSPSPGSPNNELLGVTAVASNDVWAVGYANQVAGDVYRTLALHWNGSSWQVVARPSDGDSRLNAVDALGGAVWAAGTETIGSSDTNTLVESYWVTRPVRKAYLPLVRR